MNFLGRAPCLSLHIAWSVKSEMLQLCNAFIILACIQSADMMHMNCIFAVCD